LKPITFLVPDQRAPLPMCCVARIRATFPVGTGGHDDAEDDVATVVAEDRRMIRN